MATLVLEGGLLTFQAVALSLLGSEIRTQNSFASARLCGNFSRCPSSLYPRVGIFRKDLFEHDSAQWIDFVPTNQYHDNN